MNPGTLMPQSSNAATQRIIKRQELGLDKALITDVFMLEEAQRLGASPNYQTAYNADPVAFHARSLLWGTAFYQQLHAVVALASYRVVRERGAETPKDNIQDVRQFAKSSDAEFQAEVRAVDASLRLLEHLCRVRNRAFQHRAREGHWLSNQIVLPDAVVFARAVDASIPDGTARKIRDFMRGLRKRYQFEPIGDDPLSEAAHLAVACFALHDSSPGEFATAWRLLEEGGLYLPVLSLDFFRVVDTALADLILLIPPSTEDEDHQDPSQ